ncbi:MAG: cyclic nucleotide-binding domain-containing protein, partial [Mariprofundaceae bacterium]
MAQGDSTIDRDDSQIAVYGDLAKLYPENEGYLRKYADLLIEAGQQSTAKEVLQHLHKLLMDKGNTGRANDLLNEYPLIGRIRAIGDTGRKPIIQLLPDEMQGKVWQFMHQQRVKEGHHLFRQGDKGDTMYLLLKGELAIFVTSARGKTVLLNLIEPGDVVGEGCLLDPGVRNADVVANKDSLVIKLPRKKIIQALIDNPGLEGELKRISDFRYMTYLISGNPLLQKIPMDMRQDIALETEIRPYATGEIIHGAGDELKVVDMLVRGEAAYTITIHKTRHVL